MSKVTEAGIDVSKDVLDVAVRRDGERMETARFENDAAGHRKLTHNARGLARGHYRVAKDIYPKLAEISEREWIELLEDEMAEVQP